MCYRFVLILAASLVLGFVSMSVVYVVCFLRLGIVIFVFSVIGVVGGVPLWIVCVFRCVGVVCVVHPVAILSAVFCVFCCLCLMLVVTIWWSTKWIQPARGWFAAVRGTVQIVSTSLEARPPIFFKASHATPQHGWRSISLRETLSPIQDQNQH